MLYRGEDSRVYVAGGMRSYLAAVAVRDRCSHGRVIAAADHEEAERLAIRENADAAVEAHVEHRTRRGLPFLNAAELRATKDAARTAAHVMHCDLIEAAAGDGDDPGLRDVNHVLRIMQCGSTAMLTAERVAKMSG